MTRLPETTEALIAADSKYWLWVNGAMTVREGGLKRGSAPGDGFFDQVDILPFLREGENLIAVLLWYWGRSGFSHDSSGKAAFLLELDLGGGNFNSDSSWKARVHPCFGNTGGLQPNFRLPEGNVRYDARQSIGDWNAPGYDDSSWPAAEELGTPPCAPWGKLWPRPVPMWKDHGLKDYEAIRGPRTGPGTLRAVLPYSAQVTPWLQVDAKPGRVIRVRMDNYWHLARDFSPPVRGEYVTREGVQDFELPGWMSGHEVRYALPRGVRMLGVKYRESGYDADFAGSFECSDPFLNLLWEKARRSLYVCMRDSYMDCPDRERAQWWGDVVNEHMAAAYCLDPAAALLTRKAVHDLVLHAEDDGSLHSPVPGKWKKELPQQILASVGLYGFPMYALHTGDLETLGEAYPYMLRYLALWRMGDDGLVEHRRGGWDWVDWGPGPDAALMENCWYCLALEGAQKAAVLLGKPEEAGVHSRKRGLLAAAIDGSMWSGRDYRSLAFGNRRRPADDRGNALAVLCGAAGRARFQDVRHVLEESHNASPFMEKFVLEALFVMGAEEQALARMKRRYGPIVSLPLSTLPERWNIRRANVGYNHGWNAGIAALLSGKVAGIAPINPGYAVFEVRPLMGTLTRVRCVVETVRGRIEAAIDRDDGRFRMELMVPRDTEALLTLPVPAHARITIAGRAGEGVAAASPGSGSGARHYRLGPGRREISALW